MKHIVLVAGSLVALSGAAVLASGCGSGETGQGASAAAESANQRQAASKPVQEKCPEKLSSGYELTITNQTESVLYPSGEGWTCRSWSGWGNPSALNSVAVGPGQQKTVRLEGAALYAEGEYFTINFRFGTNVKMHMETGTSFETLLRLKNDDGKYTCDTSRLLPGRFGPNTMRVTLKCGEAAKERRETMRGNLIVEQFPKEQPSA
jgi:hypothetical protein